MHALSGEFKSPLGHSRRLEILPACPTKPDRAGRSTKSSPTPASVFTDTGELCPFTIMDLLTSSRRCALSAMASMCSASTSRKSFPASCAAATAARTCGRACAVRPLELSTLAVSSSTSGSDQRVAGTLGSGRGELCRRLLFLVLQPRCPGDLGPQFGSGSRPDREFGQGRTEPPGTSPDRRSLTIGRADRRRAQGRTPTPQRTWLPRRHGVPWAYRSTRRRSCCPDASSSRRGGHGTGVTAVGGPPTPIAP